MEESGSTSVKFQIKGSFKRKRPLDINQISESNEDDDKVIAQSSDDNPIYFKGDQLKYDDEKPPLVIPLIDSFSSKNVESTNISDQAIMEILKETTSENVLNQTDLIIKSNNDDFKSQADRKAPLLLANIANELKGLNTDDERFKKDMALRADDLDVKSERYKSVPVEQFGAALLRGMGWNGPTEEDKIRMKKSEEPMIARDNRLGLGAIVKPPEGSSKHSSKQKAKDIWNKKVDETIKKQVLAVGDLVWLRTISEVGKRAQIIAIKGVPGLDKVRVRMESDGRILEIVKSEIVLLTEAALTEQPYETKYKDLGDVPSKTEYRGIDVSNESKTTLNNVSEKSKTSREKVSSRDDSGTTTGWICPFIRVRVVTEKLNRRAYLQKGNVVDVHSGGIASIRLDDGTFIDSVKEKYLETVLPQINGTCKVLRGYHKGAVAVLLEKKRDVDRAVIQLQEDLEVIEISMNDIAATC